jgi:hypothetical protein
MRYNPYDENYYFIEIFADEVKQLNFSGNLKPVVEVSPDLAYGQSPLTVQFDTDGTYDPEGDPLTFSWDFGDGESSTTIHPSHNYESPNNDPISFTTTLTVRDTADNVVLKNILVSLNNSPPTVDISSIIDGQLYRMDEPSSLPLRALVSDAEHSDPELDYRWNIYLHHNNHFHPLADFDAHQPDYILHPTGCEDISTYYFRVALEVTDPEGLSAFDEVYLYPDCEGILIPKEGFEAAVLYPNPNNGRFTLAFDPEGWNEKQLNVRVIDSRGGLFLDQDIFVHAFRKSFEFDLSTVPQGMYFLIVEGDGLSFQERLVIHHY